MIKPSTITFTHDHYCYTRVFIYFYELGYFNPSSERYLVNPYNTNKSFRNLSYHKAVKKHFEAMLYGRYNVFFKKENSSFSYSTLLNNYLFSKKLLSFNFDNKINMCKSYFNDSFRREADKIIKESFVDLYKTIKAKDAKAEEIHKLIYNSNENRNDARNVIGFFNIFHYNYFFDIIEKGLWLSNGYLEFSFLYSLNKKIKIEVEAEYECNINTFDKPLSICITISKVDKSYHLYRFDVFKPLFQKMYSSISNEMYRDIYNFLNQYKDEC